MDENKYNTLRGSYISWFPCRSSVLVELDLGMLVLREGGKPGTLR